MNSKCMCDETPSKLKYFRCHTCNGELIELEGFDIWVFQCKCGKTTIYADYNEVNAVPDEDIAKMIQLPVLINSSKS